MCFEAAQAPSQQQTYGQALGAQVRYAPQIYQENAQFSPLYTQLDLSNLMSFMNGTNGNGGFLQEYTNGIMPALTAAQNTANNSIRQNNVSEAQALTPQWIAGERNANPGAAGLLDSLTSNASRDLSYGTELTPAEKVQLNQSVRGGQAARGMGFGPSDVFNESLADTGMGQELYAQREGAAQGLVPTLQGFYGDPMGALSGMTSNAGMNASAITGAAGSGAASAQSGEFNPQTMAMQGQSIGAQLGQYNAGVENLGSGTSGGAGMMSY